MVWLNAPRWSYVPIYIALGWAALGFLPQFWREAGPSIVWLILAGGVAYTGGAVIYALKRPNPVPGWFGFHEVFHAGTVAGFTCHFTAIWLIAVR
jgi:hemolysin III